MSLSDPIIAHTFAFDVWKLQITGFGLAVLAAFFIAQYVCERELTRRGQLVEAAAMGDVTFAALIGTLLGAKLYYVGVITHDIRDLFTRGGFVYWGGFIGSVICCWLVIRWRKLSFLRFADVAGIAIAAGYAVGRTGCWAVGDDYGKYWTGPLAVAFPEGAPPSTVATMMTHFNQQFDASFTNPNQVVTVIPTQLVEVVLGFVMFLILWRFRGHRHAPGWLFGGYCVLAGIERFIVEFMRAKDDRFAIFAPFSTAQAIAVGVMLVGVAVMFARRNRQATATP
ncbi:MAG TPA: prolipoprotein diacylglyceryl transferase family protein [Gemmatimonadaceae bacterium]|nr:prolipoprotein diacylglyceryl transferase family protein [Gemmatimonadaceae bacterium]